MKNLKLRLANLVKDESGQDLIEYALIASSIALIAVAAMSSLSGAITAAFASIVSSLTPKT